MFTETAPHVFHDIPLAFAHFLFLFLSILPVYKIDQLLCCVQCFCFHFPYEVVVCLLFFVSFRFALHLSLQLDNNAWFCVF